MPSFPESTSQKGQAGREAGRKAEGKQAEKQKGSRQEGRTTQPPACQRDGKSEGAVVCHPTPFNLACASTV